MIIITKKLLRDLTVAQLEHVASMTIDDPDLSEAVDIASVLIEVYRDNNRELFMLLIDDYKRNRTNIGCPMLFQLTA